ncbi:AraC-like DNA-binding protein [Duganella sp. 1224]|uniref:AraC family transcriptional regulator n=1 Tax=Duganella sp. 1224 TaxID=2587052 RepID=UPI0015C98F22|nr:AraC family transcriptional regulator [Duganella sp. 1224]NYE59948.1 AraC-like DNA-binding protein [Duganella sp. 1224]
MGQVKVAIVLPLLNYLRRHQLAHELLVVDDAAQTMSCEAWLALYQRAIAASGDPALPLRVGAAMQPSDYSMLGFAAMSCVTLEQAIHVMLRYERLVQEVNATGLVVGDSEVALQWLPYLGPVSPIFMQLALASWAAMARRLTGRPQQAFEAHFSFPPPPHADVYQEIFGKPARFSQPMTKLVFERDLLSQPVLFGDAQTNQILLQKAEEQLQQAGAVSIVCKVRQRLAAGGKLGVEAVAEDLRMSPRKLQLLLANEGSSFRKLQHEALFQRAKDYLADPAISVSEVAFLLGYSEQSPFQNAFKNWAGMTPGAWRRNAVARRV